MLYQVLEIMPDLSLDKLYKEINKRTVSERSIATASLTVNGRYRYSGEDVEHREGGHVLANYEQKGGAVSNPFFACWNCNSNEHQARKCPTPLSAKVRDMIEGSDPRKVLYMQRQQKGKHVSSPSKYESHSEQKDSRRRRETEYDDGDEDEEEAQTPVRGKTPTPSYLHG